MNDRSQTKSSFSKLEEKCIAQIIFDRHPFNPLIIHKDSKNFQVDFICWADGWHKPERIRLFSAKNSQLHGLRQSSFQLAER